MPITLTTPTTGVTTTTVRIESFTVGDLNETGGPVVHVNYSRGDVVGGIFTARSEEFARLSGASLAAKMADVINNTTLYDAIKAALYDLLLTGNHVGAGVVS